VLQHVVQLYAQAKAIQAHLAALPSYLPPQVPYQLDGFSLVSVAAADYLLGQPGEAVALAQGELSSQQAHTREVAEMVVLAAKDRMGVLKAYVEEHPGIQASYQLLMGAKQALAGS